MKNIADNDVILNDEYKSSSNYRAWVVCMVASLFIFYEFIQLNLPNVMGMRIMEMFSVNADQLGKLSASYFFANVLFLIPAGILLDRWSVKKLIITSLSLSLFGRFLYIYPFSFNLLVIGRFMIGISGAFSFLSCIKLASRWFPPCKMGIIIGFASTSAMLGGFVSQTPFAYLFQYLGWHITVLSDIGLGIIIMFLTIYFVEDFPDRQKTILIKSWKEELNQLKYNLQKTFFRPKNWLCGIYSGGISQPIFLLGGLWGILYIRQTYNFSEILTSDITSMIFVGAIIGTPLVGWISDKIHSRKLPMFMCAVLCLIILIYIMYFTTPSINLLFFLFFMLGIVTSSQALGFPLVTQINSKEVTAIANSIISICAIGGGALFETLFGHIMGLHWSGKIINKIPIYSIANYRFAFWIFIVGITIGIVALFFVKEPKQNTN